MCFGNRDHRLLVMSLLEELFMENSKKIFEKACNLMPGGVSSPVRAYKAVKGTPPVIKKAFGSTIVDADDRRYTDYVCSWGAALLGHAHPEVVAEVQKVAQDGLSFGAPTELENALAEKIQHALPSIEQIRFVSTGTEACMSAIRLARGYTGRAKILKFDGHYHGHADSLLAKAGSGVATFSLPDSQGVLESATRDTLIAPFNNIDAVRALFTDSPDDIAAVILEPVAGNCGMIEPETGFLESLRKICDEYGALLIFDEVMTGFRVAWGGAQNLYKIRPDLTTLAKVIGGGMPLAAYGGKREIMQKLAPVGPVYQAGTLSGNPVATACGLKTLEIIERDVDYTKLEKLGSRLMEGFHSAAQAVECSLSVKSIGGMVGFYFGKDHPKNFEQAKMASVDRFVRFFHAMLEKGIYLAPSAFEAGFISSAHTEEDVIRTIEIAEVSFREIMEQEGVCS